MREGRHAHEPVLLARQLPRHLCWQEGLQASNNKFCPPHLVIAGSWAPPHQRCWKLKRLSAKALMHMNRMLKPISTAAAGPMKLHLQAGT